MVYFVCRCHRIYGSILRGLSRGTLIATTTAAAAATTATTAATAATTAAAATTTTKAAAGTTVVVLVHVGMAYYFRLNFILQFSRSIYQISSDINYY